MKKKFSFLKSIILIFLISNCGFKVVDQSKLINFKVDSISISGDNRVSYIIKNKLLPYSKNNEKKIINLDIEVKKTKDIKEKNIKNEITKYEIIIKTKVDYDVLFHNKKGHFTVTKIGNYKVESQYSQTLINEDNLIDDLREKLAEDIQENLSVLTNDL